MAGHAPDPAPDAAPVAAPRRGPRTAGGKARSAKNALKHGLRARRLVLLEDESVTDFAKLEAGVRAELAPEGVFEQELVMRIVTALWRARRADRMEAALLGRYLARVWPEDNGDLQIALGFGVMRDGNGPRGLDLLGRYRGSLFAELFRSLAALDARQAPARSTAAAAPRAPELSAAKTERIQKRRLEPRS